MMNRLDQINKMIDNIVSELSVDTIEEKRLQVDLMKTNIKKQGYSLNEDALNMFDMYISGDITIIDLSEWLRNNIWIEAKK